MNCPNCVNHKKVLLCSDKLPAIPLPSPQPIQLTRLDDIEVPKDYNDFSNVYNAVPYNNNVGVRKWAGVHPTLYPATRLDQELVNYVPPDDLPIIRRRQMVEGFGADINTNTLIRVLVICAILALVWYAIQGGQFGRRY